MNDIKYVIFDYGGTIDTRGDHWAQVIWKAYQRQHVPVDEATFRKAFVYAERTLGRNPIITPTTTFQKLLDVKLRLQLQYIITNKIRCGVTVENETSQHDFKKIELALLTDLYKQVKIVTAESRVVLRLLSQRFPMALVSNFYGNIDSVLSEFQLQGIFQTVVESAIVGIRKPDPQIFAVAMQRMGAQPEQTLVVGDSLSKDIQPAQTLGCKTVWMKGLPWDANEAPTTKADFVIDRIEELPKLLGVADC